VSLVDCYINSILLARIFLRTLGDSTADIKIVREKFIEEANQCRDLAITSGFSEKMANDALFPVVAYIDELVLCSSWPQKNQWQKRPLQRHFFNTANIGAEFYQRLNEINKHGTDKAIREVYVLCLGLGFKGKYFSSDDRRVLEEIKGFNVSVLLPEEAQRNLETATLFPAAYGSSTRDGKGSFKARLNVIPYVIGVPLILSITLIIFYHFKIVDVLNLVLKTVK
jgi:type VI secretion system protein ImpK